MPSSATASTPVSVGQYDLLERIGQGSVSTVFKGCHRETGQLVAVKVVYPPYSNNEVLRKRLEQEFRTSSTLRHPHIVRALEFGFQAPAAYLVLEYVDGPDLWARVERDGPLSEAEVTRLVIQVAQGLHHVHKHGVIHRDVKPQNILLTADGQAKLADLGLMKDLETDLGLTERNKALGSPSFIAPEQFQDAKSAGVRCDVYGLGATLYWAVTGQLPFQARGLGSLLQKKLQNAIVPPRDLVPSLSVRLERAILRAVRADPEVRPRSCLEFIEILTKDPTDPGEASAVAPAARRDGKRRRPQRPPRERRAAVRYPCDLDTDCEHKISIHADGEDQNSWEATVRDLSVRGIGLILARRFEPGTVLAVRIQTSDGRAGQWLEMRVKRVEEAGRERWFIGGSLAKPLSKEELRGLL
jgi:serine/threonine protein kinase